MSLSYFSNIFFFEVTASNIFIVCLKRNVYIELAVMRYVFLCIHTNKYFFKNNNFELSHLYIKIIYFTKISVFFRKFVTLSYAIPNDINQLYVRGTNCVHLQTSCKMRYAILEKLA